ncbi:cytochrome C [candidate division KSB1 bacterium]
MRHDKHVFRLVFLLVLAFGGVLTARNLLVPASFGQYGHYRGDNIAEQMAKPVSHGGPESCRSCHAEEYGIHSAGSHKTVPCEDCHAPLITHANADEKTGEMAVDRSWALCARCHRLLAARPKNFPQVQVEAHLEEMGADLEREVCIACHQSHAPIEGLR